MIESFRENMMRGVELIAAITDPDEMAEVEEGVRQTIERLEARLSSITDQPIQRAMAEPVEDAPESQPEPRQPRVRFTGRMTPAEVRRMFNATRMAG